MEALDPADARQEGLPLFCLPKLPPESARTQGERQGEHHLPEMRQ